MVETNMFEFMVDVWCDDYSLPDNSVQYIGELQINMAYGFRVGQTKTYYMSAEPEERWSEIYLNIPKRLPPIWVKEAVLWHEFCHAKLWVANEYLGHGSEFKKMIRTNKKYWLIDIFVVKLFGWYWYD